MTKSKIKLLALDLDGTTLTDNNTLTKEVRSAIEKAIDNNIIIVAASGRPFGTMPKNIIDIPNLEYVISSNGAGIYKNGEAVKRILVDENDVLKFLDITEPYDLIFEGFINGLTYTDLRYVQDPRAYGCSEAYVDYVRSSYGHIADMRKFIYEHRNEFDSLEILEHNEKLRSYLWNELETKTKMYITSSTPSFVEMMNKNATKAYALEWICSYLGIEKENTSACGNADNDADMVRWSGMGVAVSNASENCLNSADIIVSSNNENGVAELIETILQHNSNCD